MLAIYLADNVKARRMNQDGTYSRVPREERTVSAQLWFLEQGKTAKKSR